MSILLGATCIVGILFMATFMFIGIWLFIVALKAFQQMRYNNYILEKIHEKLDVISTNTTSYSKEDLINENKSSINEFDLDNEENISEFENLKNIK
ncbi:MAG: hypothetical protein E7214_11305 [Clostridium sp.]|nr:hypothetical protein [Clostridium sp.]